MFDCLAVTEVKVIPFHSNNGSIKGMATVVLNDQLVVRDLRIVDGPHGLFVSYPNNPFYKGEDFQTIVQPITRQLKEHIECAVLEEYQCKIEGAKNG